MNNKNIYHGKLNAAGISVKIALCAVLWIYLIDLAYSGCAPSLPESQVARMCRESEALGSTIYIDTSQAKATDNSSGPLCVCNITVSNAKFVNVRVQENLGSCGSKLKFSFTNKQIESDENKCRSYKELVQIENQQEVLMSIEKIAPPYSVDFCTKIEIVKCSNQDDYQCDSTAECIAKTNMCDHFPDCLNNDDEGDMCKSVRNQGEYDTSTEAQPTTPIINIQCYESTRFLTTSTTTTTTTTITPSTTTSTTTTPANSKENGPVDDSTKDDDVLTTVKKPYVIAGLVVAALVLVAITTCLVLAVRRKMKKS